MAVKAATGMDYSTNPLRPVFLDVLLEANSLWYPLRYPGEYNGKTINQAIHYHYPTADDMQQILSLRTYRDFMAAASTMIASASWTRTRITRCISGPGG